MQSTFVLVYVVLYASRGICLSTTSSNVGDDSTITIPTSTQPTWSTSPPITNLPSPSPSPSPASLVPPTTIIEEPTSTPAITESVTVMSPQPVLATTTPAPTITTLSPTTTTVAPQLELPLAKTKRLDNDTMEQLKDPTTTNNIGSYNDPLAQDNTPVPAPQLKPAATGTSDGTSLFLRLLIGAILLCCCVGFTTVAIFVRRQISKTKQLEDLWSPSYTENDYLRDLSCETVDSYQI